jgi:hypothetical protein
MGIVTKIWRLPYLQEYNRKGEIILDPGDKSPIPSGRALAIHHNMANQAQGHTCYISSRLTCGTTSLRNGVAER